MKKRTRSVMAAVAGLCLLAALSPHLFRDSGFTRFGWDSLTGPHNFYFAKRQWLADARTIGAGFRYLCDSLLAGPAIPANATVCVPAVETGLFQELPQGTNVASSKFRPAHSNQSPASLQGV
jgi:hypothetical protein